MEHFAQFRGAWDRFDDEDEAWVAIVTGVGDAFCTGADLKTYIPQVTAMQRRMKERPDRCDRRLPARRRREGRAPRREDLQADHRRGERGLCRGRHGDARRMRSARRRARSDVRGHGAEARAVRRRRDDRPAAEADPVPARDGVPALRGQDPRREGILHGTAERDRSRLDELRDAAIGYAARITANGPFAIRKTKESVLRGLATDMREAYKIESAISAEVFSSQDAKEGPQRSPRSDRRDGSAGERNPVRVAGRGLWRVTCVTKRG